MVVLGVKRRVERDPVAGGERNTGRQSDPRSPRAIPLPDPVGRRRPVAAAETSGTPCSPLRPAAGHCPPATGSSNRNDVGRRPARGLRPTHAGSAPRYRAPVHADSCGRANARVIEQRPSGASHASETTTSSSVKATSPHRAVARPVVSPSSGRGGARPRTAPRRLVQRPNASSPRSLSTTTTSSAGGSSLAIASSARAGEVRPSPRTQNDSARRPAGARLAQPHARHEVCQLAIATPSLERGRRRTPSDSPGSEVTGIGQVEIGARSAVPRDEHPPDIGRSEGKRCAARALRTCRACVRRGRESGTASDRVAVYDRPTEVHRPKPLLGAGAVLAGSELAAMHRFTLLGPAWPLARLLVHSGRAGVRVHRSGGPSIDGYPAFLLCGLVAWTWFSTGVGAGTAALVTRRHLVLQPRASLGGLTGRVRGGPAG